MTFLNDTWGPRKSPRIPGILAGSTPFQGVEESSPVLWLFSWQGRDVQM